MILSMKPIEPLELTGQSPQFEGTSYCGHTFKLRITPLTRTDYSRIQAKLARKGEEDRKGKQRPKAAKEITAPELSAEVFVECVVSWEGLKDETGADIPCNEATKRVIVDQHWQFASIVSSFALEDQVKSEEDIEAETKNSSAPGNGG